MHRLEDGEMQDVIENVELESIAAEDDYEKSMNSSFKITRYDEHNNRPSHSDMVDGHILTIPHHPPAKVNSSISRRTMKNKMMIQDSIDEHEIYKPGPPRDKLWDKTPKGEVTAGKAIDLLSTAYTESRVETPEPAYDLYPSAVDPTNPTPAPTVAPTNRITHDSQPKTIQPAPLGPMYALDEKTEDSDTSSSSSSSKSMTKEESKNGIVDIESMSDDTKGGTTPQYHDYSSKNLMTLAQMNSIRSILSEDDNKDKDEVTTKTFDPSVMISSMMLTSPVLDSPDFQSVYKMKPVLGLNNISNSGVGHLDSVRTNDSIGTKMPQYRGGGSKHHHRKIKSPNVGDKNPFKTYASQQSHEPLPQAANHLDEEDTFEKRGSASHSGNGTVRYVG